MMVKVRVEVGEEENESFYAIPETETTQSSTDRESDGADEDGADEDVIQQYQYGVGGFDPNNPADMAAKYDIVQHQ
jgi:hypothetical protein